MNVFFYPARWETSVLSPDRPELMDRGVGECLSVMLQEDMLMGSARPYGSRLNTDAMTVRTDQNKGSEPGASHRGVSIHKEKVPLASASSSCR